MAQLSRTYAPVQCPVFGGQPVTVSATGVNFPGRWLYLQRLLFCGVCRLPQTPAGRSARFPGWSKPKYPPLLPSLRLTPDFSPKYKPPVSSGKRSSLPRPRCRVLRWRRRLMPGTQRPAEDWQKDRALYAKLRAMPPRAVLWPAENPT